MLFKLSIFDDDFETVKEKIQNANNKTKFDFDRRQLLIDFNSVEIPKDSTYDQNQIAITSFDGKNVMVDNKFNEDYKRIPER